jgi:hypothetical protein
MDYKVTRIGQTVLTCKVPDDIITTINKTIDEKINSLPKANLLLAGKIKDEFVLFSEAGKFNCLPHFVLDWFKEAFSLYFEITGNNINKAQISSIWFNEMKKNEYNPLHIHTGSQAIGLSSVMFLKLPSNFGKEYSQENELRNGRLELVGNQTQFHSGNFLPEQKVGHFLIFPYDMQHIVYPFHSTDEVRRTLSCNLDVFHSIINVVNY